MTAALDDACVVVAIGGPADALEASRALLRALPANTGMAFVLLHPDHFSMLAETLARETAMPVTQVVGSTPIQPNHVYVIPPGARLTMADGQLKVAPRGQRAGRYGPIDEFLSALAQNRGYKAVGVVLGTSPDGALGLEDIKAEGGITLAEGAVTQRDGMPRSAIGVAFVDFVLPPEGIAEALIRIARHPYIAPPAEQPQLDLKPVIQLLHHATGVDLSHYRHSTLQRRVARRMVLHRVEDTPRYAELLKSDPGEVEALYQDILIGVTSFFRNPECFEALKTKVFPSFVEGRSRHETLRVWVLGCSTGEEAYSIAIALAEFLESQQRQIPVQIFGTDVNGVAIEKARGGVYSRAIADVMPPQRLRGYFVETEGGYRVNKAIRDMCVFARHNALCEPPFSRIDLIMCRNLLIYLGADMQQRVLQVLHYALKPGGYLLLGASETAGAHRDLFEAEDPKHKIFRKKALLPRSAIAPPADASPRPDAARQTAYPDSATREYLQVVIGQQEAANEELQSANEELQSINQELEMSKEALQSSNQELATVNEALHNRNIELAQSNNDLFNLLGSAQIAIIVLAPNLTIRRYTPAAETSFGLMPADVGRPITELNPNITVPDLEQQVRHVIESATAREFEVRDRHGHWYLLRLRPYRSLENRIDGAVLLLIDIDGVKRREDR